jgi:hypothetical protein
LSCKTNLKTVLTTAGLPEVTILNLLALTLKEC